MKIEIAALVAHAVAHNDRLEVIDDDPRGDVLHYLTETSDAYATWLREHGLYLDGDHVHYDPSQRDAIVAESNAIIDEYDSDTEPTNSLWSKYGLGGDDDVDYNGGYVLTFVDLLDDYLKYPKIPE